MLNVKTEIKGNELVIRVDLAQRNGLSSTGKTMMVASTKGNANVGKDGIKFGLNVFAPVGG